MFDDRIIVDGGGSVEELDKSWKDYFFGFAKLASVRSTCIRRIVGAVLVKDKRVIATGYNGAPSGIKSCKELGKCLRNELNIPSGERHECCRAAGAHAESNAVAQCARHGMSSKGAVMFCTTAPCSMCVAVMINAGISSVYYLEGYFNPTIDLVKEHSEFKIIKVDPTTYRKISENVKLDD